MTGDCSDAPRIVTIYVVEIPESLSPGDVRDPETATR
jgi:hypothetical protein